MEQRVNIYGFPHKGLRHGLGKLSLAIGNLDTNDKNAVASVVALAEELSELLGLHLHAEEDFVNPHMEAEIPGSTQHNHEDHEAMEALENEVMATIKALGYDPNPGTQEIAYQAINLFIREYFRHMSEEEVDMNKVIWENFSDQDILSWQGQILSKLSPEQFFKWFKYIIPALSPFEQHIMLGGFKSNAPSEAYQATIKGLEPFVSAKQFAHIQTI